MKWMKKWALMLCLGGLLVVANQTVSADEWVYATDDDGYNSGQLIVSKTKKNTEQQEETSLETEALVSHVTVSSDIANFYPVGQCTWGAKSVATWASNYWGNANDWAANAAADGFTVGTTPAVGAIIVWSDGGYGHVGYVTDVAEDGTIQILESNYNGNMYVANYRGYFDPNNSWTPGEVSYIYAPA